jgi:hypothetical protein
MLVQTEEIAGDRGVEFQVAADLWMLNRGLSSLSCRAAARIVAMVSPNGPSPYLWGGWRLLDEFATTESCLRRKPRRKQGPERLWWPLKVPAGVVADSADIWMRTTS